MTEQEQTSLIPRLISLIFDAGKAIRGSLRAKKADPATYAQLGVLHYLHDEGSMPMRQLADNLSITPGSLTPLVDRLCVQGHLQRTSNKKDKRTVMLKLTKKGERVFCEHAQSLSESMAAVFKKLSIQNQKRLIHVLEEIREVYKK